MRSRALALGSVALLAGCTDPAQRAADDALAIQRAVALPAVTAARGVGAPPRAPPPRLRIVVSQSSVSVDDAALFASWPAPRRARLLQSLPADDAAALPFVHRDLIRVAGDHIAPPDTPPPGTYDLRALHAVLDFARDVERRYADLEAADGPAPEADVYAARAVSVYAAGDVPYGVLVPVLYTAAQAEYAPVIVARGAQGDVDLGFDVPRIGDRSSVVRLVLGRTGSFVTAEASVARVRRTPRTEAARGSSLGRPLVGADRACPLPAGGDGAPDRGRLRDLLRALAQRAPEGTAVVITPHVEMRWRAVAAVADVAAEAGFPRFMLGVEREPEALDCAEAVSVDEVRAEEFPGGR